MTPTFSMHLVVIVLVAMLLYYVLQQQDIVHLFREGMKRESSRLTDAIEALWTNVLEEFGLEHTLGGLVGGLLAPLLLVYGIIPPARRAILDAWSRRESVRTRQLFHATSFNHLQNRQAGTRYSNLYELFLMETVLYVTTATNLIAIVIVIVQGFGSRWKKHRINLLLYIAFWLAALFSAVWNHLQQSWADAKSNHALYRCCTVGTSVELPSAGSRIASAEALSEQPKRGQRAQEGNGFTWEPAESIGLGNLVVVPAGERVPINGFVLSQNQAGVSESIFPFSYSVTGENTVKGPVRTLPLRYEDIRSVRVGPAEPSGDANGEGDADQARSEHLSTGVAAGGSASESMLEDLGRRHPSGPSSPPARLPRRYPGSASSLATRRGLEFYETDLRDTAFQMIQRSAAKPRLSFVSSSSSLSRARAPHAGGRRRIGGTSRSLSPDSAPLTPGLRRRRSANAHQSSSAHDHGLQPLTMQRSISENNGRQDLHPEPEEGGSPHLGWPMDATDTNEDRAGTDEAREGTAEEEEWTEVPEAQSPDVQEDHVILHGDDSSEQRPNGVADNSAKSAAEERHFINGIQIPDDFLDAMVPRDTVHAPPGSLDPSVDPSQLPPLYVLAGVPQQYQRGDGSASCAPEPSRWDQVVGRVIVFQVIVLVTFSLINWASGQAMREMDITLESFLGFVLGQFAMGNALIPTKHVELTAVWWALVKGYFPDITVKAWAALESIRDARIVVADKTGTLTLDTMTYSHQLRNPNWTDPLGMGCAWMLCTNDSRPNPLGGYRGPGVNPRLVQAPALCSNPEEGVVFDSLTRPPELEAPLGRPSEQREWVELTLAEPLQSPHDVLEQSELSRLARSIQRGQASPPTGTRPSPPQGRPGLMRWRAHPMPGHRPEDQPEHQDAAPVEWRVAVHSKTGVRESLVARLSVVSMWSRPQHRAGDADVDNDPLANRTRLEEAGWESHGSWLIVQGGGDTVAESCGASASAWETAALNQWPDRTFAHALAKLPSEVPSSEILSWDHVEALHAECQESGRLQLAFLSKFGNPVVDGVPEMFAALQEHGIQIHICTGDTYLTLRAVLQDMGAVPRQRGIDDGGDPAAARLAATATHVREELWDGEAARRQRAIFEQEEFAAGETLHQMGEDVAGRTWTPQDSPHPPSERTAELRESVGPAQRVNRLLQDWSGRVVIFCSSPMMHLLHKWRTHRDVDALLNHPRVMFAWYRIRSAEKPMATSLMSRRGTGAPPVFVGDGPNDAPVLASTPHSVAVENASVPAKQSANFQVTSAASLMDIWEMSRLFQGGRTILLRDVVFVGGIVVILNSVGAHLKNFEPMGDKLVVVEDPWSPLLMTLYTAIFHMPRVLVLALNEGRKREWNLQPDAVIKVGLEAIFAILSSLWVGIQLKQYGEDIATFAGLALVSVAVLTYLRQNLLISGDLHSPPRLQPRRFANNRSVAPSSSSGVGSRAMGLLGWALNGLPGQSVLVVIFAMLVAPSSMRVREVLWIVGEAVTVPACAMLLVRLVQALHLAHEHTRRKMERLQLQQQGRGDEIFGELFWDDEAQDEEDDEEAWERANAVWYFKKLLQDPVGLWRLVIRALERSVYIDMP